MNSSSRVGRASHMIQEAILANDCSSASTRQLAADMNHPFTMNCIKDTGEDTKHHLVADCKCH